MSEVVCWSCGTEVVPETHPNGERTCPECGAADPDTGGTAIPDGGVSRPLAVEAEQVVDALRSELDSDSVVYCDAADVGARTDLTRQRCGRWLSTLANQGGQFWGFPTVRLDGGRVDIHRDSNSNRTYRVERTDAGDGLELTVDN